MTGGVTILGIFAADLAFRAPRLPRMGETLLGSGFSIGCGGKGSNQAVASSRFGAPTRLITRIGRDVFGDMALRLWTEEGIDTRYVARADEPTGAAFIFLDEMTAENAIIVDTGAAKGLSEADLVAAEPVIRSSAVFATQLEQPVPLALRALRMAKAQGVLTVFNPAPAPATPLPADVWRLCDVVTPNETEAAALTGIAVDTQEAASAAAARLIEMGARMAIVTLGARGILLHMDGRPTLIDAIDAGPVRDTTGAGDAFNGAFCAALAQGVAPADAARMANAAAGIAVTRPGTAAAMPSRREVERLLAGA